MRKLRPDPIPDEDIRLILEAEDDADAYLPLCDVLVTDYSSIFFDFLGTGRPVWVEDAHFHLDYHVRRTALPAPGGDEELRNLVGRVMAQKLDRSKPLWEMWLVEGLEVVSVEHATRLRDLADGSIDYGDEEGWVDCFTEDGVLQLDEAISGREAIRVWMSAPSVIIPAIASR